MSFDLFYAWFGLGLLLNTCLWILLVSFVELHLVFCVCGYCGWLLFASVFCVLGLTDLVVCFLVIWCLLVAVFAVVCYCFAFWVVFDCVTVWVCCASWFVFVFRLNAMFDLVVSCVGCFAFGLICLFTCLFVDLLFS